MKDIAIRVENLSKRYQIGTARQRHDTLRDTIAATFKRSNESSETPDEFWALKDVSFEVQRGEVVGIIGRNGAGKSTLLKILSQITEPTRGRAEIHGRVGSLLEVGTGFHPELTGRENIYLNGAILGMRRHEIERQFDEIVAFAEIERFLDTPVKRYSSGMYVRLAFAVAAHLEPEILLVDEVLAVGDAAFQKKCLGKMGEIASKGRTVLFVSHGMGSIRQLCSEAALLDHGRIIHKGEVDSAIDRYLRGISTIDRNDPQVSSKYLQAIEFLDSSMQPVNTLLAGGGGTFRVHYDVGDCVLADVCVTIAVYDLTGIKAVQLTTMHSYDRDSLERLVGKGHIDCQMDQITLTSGQYRVNVALDGYHRNNAFHDGIVNGCQLTVLPSNYYGNSRMRANEEGFVLVKQRWSVNQIVSS
ncbi:MAG: ABC transporter ATP-binding protein [Anaerolineae bacterium]|nr:ABC transporter ATP-binding protein [Anaerolineae bacterium]